ncbi:hypothetical protein BSLG_005714 [Batrachochytrium salamandrivorans]|nr:hypothetical protein BSLG_005714 [Batrachochytrium salamandrivorans]
MSDLTRTNFATGKTHKENGNILFKDGKIKEGDLSFYSNEPFLKPDTCIHDAMSAIIGSNGVSSLSDAEKTEIVAAMYRKGHALFKMNELEPSLKILMSAVKLAPNDVLIRDQITQVKTKITELEIKSRNELRNNLKMSSGDAACSTSSKSYSGLEFVIRCTAAKTQVDDGNGVLGVFDEIQNYLSLTNAATTPDRQIIQSSGLDLQLMIPIQFQNVLSVGWKSLAISIQSPETIRSHLTLKLVVNACINPVVALLVCQNGGLLHIPNGLDLVHSLCKELAPLVLPRLSLLGIDSVENDRQSHGCGSQNTFKSK